MKTVTLKLIIDDELEGTAEIDATQEFIQVAGSMGDVLNAFIDKVEENKETRK